MGVTKVTQEMKVSVPPAVLFKGHVLDAGTVMPKALPQIIKSLELVEGNWGEPGSITKTTLQQGFVKFKIDFVDKEKMVFKQTMIEGDVLGGKIEYVSYESSYEPSGSEGCLAKLITEYHTKGDLELTEDEINEGKNRMDVHFKLVVDYIAANY